QLQLPGAALVRRAALHARIIDPEQGPINIYCTQLTRDPGPEITYPADGPFDSFAQEHEAQMEALLEYIESTRAGAPVVVLGDLGSGPDIGNNTGAFQGTFDRLLSEGQLKSPYLEASEPLCTVCVDNPLGSWTQDQVLDHSLVRDRELLDAARAFDGLWTVTTEAEEELLVPLSDRYGVSVRFR
ncbi:MAG: hypothetical protein AAFX99_33630, partial [Myxococcota bacterium]